MESEQYDGRVVKTVRLLRQRTMDLDSNSTRTSTPYDSNLLMR